MVVATCPHRPQARTDASGCPISGATEAALHEAPQFVMAHVLRAHALVCSRDPRRVRAAVPVLAGLRGLQCNAWERGHVAALQAVLADDL